MDRKLSEIEKQFYKLAELLPVVAFESDAQGHILFINDISVNVLGYTPAEVLGRPFAGFIAPADRERIIVTSRNVMADKFLGDNEFTVLKKDGTSISTFIQSAPSRNSRGEVTGLRGVLVDISKRKSIEEGLRESELKYRTLVNNINLGIIRTTPGEEGKITEVNRAMEQISGYSREELLSMKVLELYVNSADRADLFQKIVSTGKTVKGETSLRQKNGNIILISGLLTPLKDPQGNILFLDGILEDITERKRAGEIIRENERRFRELADLLPVIAFEAGLRGDLVYVNDYALNLFGYTRDEFLARSIFSFLAAEDQKRSIDNSRRVLAGEYLGNNEYIAVKKDLSRFSVLIQTAPIKDNRGKLTGIRGVLVDIDEQKKTEAELRESEAFSTSLFMNSPNPVLVIHPNYTIRQVNPAFESLTGYANSEVVGIDKPYPWWLPEQYDQIKEKSEWSLSRDSYERERCYRKKNGELFWVVISIRKVLDENGIKYFVSNWVDITERKKMEEQIVALYEKEKQQRELLQEEAKVRGMFIDVLAHELRTPLTPILASTSMLRDLTDSRDDKIRRKLTDNILNSTQTLVRRLEELLELARYSRGTFTLNLQPVDLGFFIEEVITRFKPSLALRDQRLIEELSADLPVAEIDTSRLEQVIVNLLSNASKFSPESGVIRVSVTADGHELRMNVTDYGIGIPPELQGRLFQPYHRVEQDRQQFPGLGLGLAVAKQIVEAHGGTIWLDSQPGRGSTFSFNIPLRKHEAPPI
jgi:PAS domain S-box-containing protein